MNDVIDPALPGYYHGYRLVHEEYSDRVIDGLHLVFVDLPKFKPQNFSQKKMHVLWLRYLTEIHDDMTEVSPDLKMAVWKEYKMLQKTETGGYGDPYDRPSDRFAGI